MFRMKIDIYWRNWKKVYTIRLVKHNHDATKDESKISRLSRHIKNTEIMYKEQNYVKRDFRAGVEIKKCKYSIMNKKEKIRSIPMIWLFL